MPFFSIIIPVYNKENFIARTIESVLAQSFGDFEIIIVNDGSTDTSREIIMRFTDSRIRYFSQQNSGVSSARNLGIAQASADYIAFLDADDIWYPEFLSTIRTMILQHPDQKIFSTAYEIETASTVYPVKYSLRKSSEIEVVDYLEASGKESVIWTSSAVFHKEVFSDVGLFDPKMHVGEDIDMWIRLGLKYNVVFCWKRLARYTYDAHSLTKDLNLTIAAGDFSKFSEAEKSNPKLKRYLDRNRFSLAIKSKLIKDSDAFEKQYSEIDRTNLGFKKRLLLEMPQWVLKLLIDFNHLLVRIGLKSSVFK